MFSIPIIPIKPSLNHIKPIMTPRPYFVVLGFLDANSWDPSGWERPQVPRSMDLSNILTKKWSPHISMFCQKIRLFGFFDFGCCHFAGLAAADAACQTFRQCVGWGYDGYDWFKMGNQWKSFPEIAPLKTGEMAFPTVDFSQQDMVSGHSCEQNIRYVLGSNLLQIAKQFHHLICLDV